MALRVSSILVPNSPFGWSLSSKPRPLDADRWEELKHADFELEDKVTVSILVTLISISVFIRRSAWLTGAANIRFRLP